MDLVVRTKAETAVGGVDRRRDGQGCDEAIRTAALAVTPNPCDQRTAYVESMALLAWLMASKESGCYCF